jgi:hypothetical protein
MRQKIERARRLQARQPVAGRGRYDEPHDEANHHTQRHSQNAIDRRLERAVGSWPIAPVGGHARHAMIANQVRIVPHRLQHQFRRPSVPSSKWVLVEMAEGTNLKSNGLDGCFEVRA